MHVERCPVDHSRQPPQRTLTLIPLLQTPSTSSNAQHGSRHDKYVFSRFLLDSHVSNTRDPSRLGNGLTDRRYLESNRSSRRRDMAYHQIELERSRGVRTTVIMRYEQDVSFCPTRKDQAVECIDLPVDAPAAFFSVLPAMTPVQRRKTASSNTDMLVASASTSKVPRTVCFPVTLSTSGLSSKRTEPFQGANLALL